MHVITVITDNPGDITDKTVTHDDTGNDTLGTDYDIHVTDCMPSHLSDGITDNAISHGITDKAISHDDTGNGTLGTDDDINATDCPDMSSRLADGATDNAIPHGITGDGTHTPDYHHNPDFTITDNPNYRDAGVITETPDSGHVITVITHNPADITDKTITLTHDVTGNSTLGTDSSISDDALPLGTEGDGSRGQRRRHHRRARHPLYPPPGHHGRRDHARHRGQRRMRHGPRHLRQHRGRHDRAHHHEQPHSRRRTSSSRTGAARRLPLRTSATGEHLHPTPPYGQRQGR